MEIQLNLLIDFNTAVHALFSEHKPPDFLFLSESSRHGIFIQQHQVSIVWGKKCIWEKNVRLFLLKHIPIISCNYFESPKISHCGASHTEGVTSGKRVRLCVQSCFSSGSYTLCPECTAMTQFVRQLWTVHKTCEIALLPSFLQGRYFYIINGWDPFQRLDKLL